MSAAKSRTPKAKTSSSQEEASGASTISPAPKGQNIPAQGIALGNRPTTNPCPEGATQGWQIAKISDFAKTTSGGTPSRANPEFYTGKIPWIKSGDLNDGNVSEATEFITEEALKNSSAKLFPAGTLMIALYGATIGKLGLLTIDAATNQAVCGIFVPEGVETKYLFYFLLQHRPELIKQGAGGAQPNISQGIVRDVEVPLPPLPEQRRIVARIEELFSRLDAGVAALRHAKAQLQRYRQSVLAAAVTGQLTQAWREQHPDTDPAEELLKRILEQRREQWDGRGKYSEAASPKPLAFDLPSSSWASVSIDQLAVDTTIGLVRAAVLQNSNEEGFAYLKMDKIDMNGRVNLDGLVYVDATKDEVARFSLRKGDVLFNTRNSVELVGKTGHVASEPVTPLVFNNNLMRLRFVGSALPAFVALQMCSKQFRDSMEGAKRATTSIAAVYGKDLRPLPIALPPLAEQHQIVAEVEARTTAIDNLEAELDRQITRSNRLRQSTLSSAFHGDL